MLNNLLMQLRLYPINQKYKCFRYFILLKLGQEAFSESHKVAKEEKELGRKLRIIKGIFESITYLGDKVGINDSITV